MRYVILLALAAIVSALVYAGVAMVRDGRNGAPKTDTMMRALAVRVAISVSLFVFILVCYELGWIRPTGIPLH